MTDAVDAAEPVRKKKGRSPSYPGINLETAIQRAERVYAEERRHAAPMSTITGHWGYNSPTTGPASVTYSALKKFGLLEEEGSGLDRMGTLTDLALDIILTPSEEDRLTAIRRAALMPPIHQEFWDRFKADLPSDSSLRYELVRNRGFTENGAADFIDELRETFAFARLGETVISVPDDDEVSESPQRSSAPRSSRVDGARPNDAPLSIPVPLIGAEPVIVEGYFPISERDWDQFIAVLTAMKPGLVRQDEVVSADPPPQEPIEDDN